MKTFYKSQHKIVLIVVLALLIQIVGPIVGDYAYAKMGEEGEESFTFDKVEVNNEIATIDWTFKLRSDEEAGRYEFKGDFTLEEEKSGKIIADDEDGTEIGEYTVSTEGEIIVDIDGKLYGVFQEDGEDAEENEVDEEANIGKSLALLASTGEDLHLDTEEDQDEDEEVRILVFDGSFEVGGAKKKVTILDSMKNAMMGIFGGKGNDLGNIFTDVKLIMDEEVIVPGSTIEIEDGTKVGMEFTWELGDDVSLIDGYYSEIEIPAVFDTSEIPNGKLIEKTMVDGEEVNTEVGTYSFEGGFLKVVFNNELVEKENRNGMVGFNMKFTLTDFGNEIEKEIEFGEPICCFLN